MCLRSQGQSVKNENTHVKIGTSRFNVLYYKDTRICSLKKKKKRRRRRKEEEEEEEEEEETLAKMLR